MNLTRFLIIALTAFAVTNVIAEVRLPRLVNDGMVLQRDVKLKIWGWASKGEKITVTFRGKAYNTKAAEDNTWSVILPPLKAGGPYEMVITGSNTVTLKDILVGDVWLCAGQSNMVHYLDLHKERYGEEVASANYPQIRQFLVPTTQNLQGTASDFTSGEWKAATAENIGRFSVVAYFFAKKIHEKYGVPIGLINASVGGTPIEAWTSEEGLREFPELVRTISQNKDTAYVNNINREVAKVNKERAGRAIRDKGLLDTVKWYDTSYVAKNWFRINIPGYWEDQGVKDLDGVVWYRRYIDVPESMAGLPARLALGRIVDADHVYVNGKLIGGTTYQYPQRRYQIPAGVLKAGKNLFVVRVLNYSGEGGFVPDKPYYLAAGGDTVDLKGYWHYKVGEVYPEGYHSPVGVSWQNQPTALFNGMIAPAVNYQIRGVLWYQGESNSSRPAEYANLLPALIRDWRSKWTRNDLPFLYVQLPNFMDAAYSPSDSDWALLREAQLKALKVDNTAMAVAIDLGEWNDIHPGNKKPIGERLALAAQHLAYGDPGVVYSGPVYRSYQIEGNRIRITFDHVGGGLVSTDGESLGHFAIAGPNKKFVWAHAKIDNNTVVVWSDEIPQPVYVRYAWADNPVGANLYNKEGLPASPFRTDK